MENIRKSSTVNYLSCKTAQNPAKSTGNVLQTVHLRLATLLIISGHSGYVYTYVVWGAKNVWVESLEHSTLCSSSPPCHTPSPGAPWTSARGLCMLEVWHLTPQLLWVSTKASAPPQLRMSFGWYMHGTWWSLNGSWWLRTGAFVGGRTIRREQGMDMGRDMKRDKECTQNF